MSEEFIIEFIPTRMKQLGYTHYYMRYRDMFVEAGAAVDIPAANELYFIVGDPFGIVVESDYGLYDYRPDFQSENTHQHRGQIVVTNVTIDHRRIKFIQVVIVN